MLPFLNSRVSSSSSARLLSIEPRMRNYWLSCFFSSTTTTAFLTPPQHSFRQRRSYRSYSSQPSDETTYATSYHAPVMWRECIEALLSSSEEERSSRIFVDGTLGGGGHSEALLQRLGPNDILFGCDVDPNALKTASDRLRAYMCDDETLPAFVPVQSNFCNLDRVLRQVHAEKIHGNDRGGVDGILLDLGVSSHQIDTAERGFAFMQDGPLDMRMGSEGSLTAAAICNEFDVKELARILKVYGDEPRAKAIANAIVERRPLMTTSDLMEAVATVTPQFSKKSRRMGRTATLARVFQSLRIVVNHEDKVLERALTEMAPALLRPGGRLVVLSYHSLEDRATKRVMRDGTIEKQKRQEKDIYGNYIGDPKPFRTLGKAIKASEAEVEVNPRARSATLRVAERL